MFMHFPCPKLLAALLVPLSSTTSSLDFRIRLKARIKRSNLSSYRSRPIDFHGILHQKHAQTCRNLQPYPTKRLFLLDPMSRAP